MSNRQNILNAARVLVLEDEYYLASDLQDALEAAGAKVVGPFSETGDASRALATERPDCALVDLNLGHGISFDLPKELTRLGVPFAFITGYDRGAIADEFVGITRIEKPVETRRVVELAEKLVAGQRP